MMRNETAKDAVLSAMKMEVEAQSEELEGLTAAAQVQLTQNELELKKQRRKEHARKANEDITAKRLRESMKISAVRQLGMSITRVAKGDVGAVVASWRRAMLADVLSVRLLKEVHQLEVQK